MFDTKQRLELILEALERIPRRFEGISSPDDFTNSDEGLDRMDGICMVLIAAGEEFKKIDYKTNGALFAQYPQVPWSGAIGLRNILAHAYLQVDPKQIYGICKESIPPLIETLRIMIQDLNNEITSKETDAE